MKIQTQARLLVAGIVIVPLLIFLTNGVYRQFFIERDVPGLPAYEDIHTLMDENMSEKDWESINRSVERSQNLGEVAVFRDDFLVLYSTIPEFSPGVFTTRENVMSLLDAGKRSFDYIFVSQNLEENRVFILNKTTPRTSGPRFPPFFIPAVIIFSFIILLAVFTICMSIVIIRTITRSVQVLETATRRIAEGELDLQLDIKGSNEITSLTNSLNKMRNALKEEELKRSRFIMGITHDLKTPLALIKGYAEAIEDGFTEDTISRSSAVEIITTKADQLEGMINDLINFVRMETGEWRELLEEIKLSSFINKMLKTLIMDVELLQHEFVTDINLPEDLFIPMDERLVKRALENLINNAVRHTPHGTTIKFTAAKIKNTVVLSVSDNGPGIDKEALPYVFEMFYRGSPSRREQGMGLGLAVVKWVADYHGWSIGVTTDKDKGTSFAITIPIVQQW